MLDLMTFLATVLYLHDQIPGNLMQTLLHLTLYMQKSGFKVCLLESNTRSSCYRGNVVKPLFQLCQTQYFVNYFGPWNVHVRLPKDSRNSDFNSWVSFHS